jgi:threonine dehydrogenase-like Zn-dependent dehydrogenase
MGIVEETGPAVTKLKRGDRVVVPFTISCGDCFFCKRKLFSACETTNPGEGALMNGKSIRKGSGMFGFSHLYGSYAGGQAEFVRVPKANVGPLVLPNGIADEKVLFLSDILPTGYQAVVDAGIVPGSTVAIFGAGPVGQMAAACARLLGAHKIFMVDHHPFRLQHAVKAYGVEPINFDDVDDPAQYIVDHTGMRGVDGSVDCVGFEAKGSAIETALTLVKAEGSSGHVIRQAIAATRRGGTVSLPGLYTGFIHAFMIGDAFEKGLTFKCGQTHVQRHMPKLLEHILASELHPDILISHRLSLADAAKGYKMFDEKEQDYRKVVLVPGLQ